MSQVTPTDLSAANSQLNGGQVTQVLVTTSGETLSGVATQLVSSSAAVASTQGRDSMSQSIPTSSSPYDWLLREVRSLIDEVWPSFVGVRPQLLSSEPPALPLYLVGSSVVPIFALRQLLEDLRSLTGEERIGLRWDDRSRSFVHRLSTTGLASSSAQSKSRGKRPHKRRHGYSSSSSYSSSSESEVEQQRRRNDKVNLDSALRLSGLVSPLLSGE